MKPFKSIREGNSVEPGVSEINDVPEDPMSFVEIKPKKTKVVKEGLQEAVSVKKEKHSWGTMMTVHHGSDTSYPLHPEHQSAIKKLRPGMKTTFKDETNSTVHAHREGDTVHLTRPKTGSTLTSLPYHHFDTSEHAKPAAKKPAGEYDRKVTTYLKKKYNEETEQIDELKKSTLGSYIKKASDSATMSAYGAGGESQRHAGEPVSKRPDTYGTDRKVAIKRLKGIDKATDRLTKEETVVETKGAPKGYHFTKDGKLKRGDAGQDGSGGPMLRSDPLDKQRNKIPAVSEGININTIWEKLKPEPVVEAFDAEAHKKELDRLMTKHMNAHAETTRLIKAKASQEEINKAQERNNAVKAEIRSHKDKVPAGPAPKPGSAAHYYASKKPGEYTGD